MTREELQAIRERLGYTQTAFAHRLGVGVDTVRRYERGVTHIPPSVTTLAAIIVVVKTKGLTEGDKLRRIKLILSLEKDLEEYDKTPIED